MSTPEDGVAIVQRAGREASTALHNTTMNKGKKVARVIAGFVVVSALLAGIFWFWWPEEKRVAENTVPKEPQSVPSLTGVVRWKQLEQDGSIPVGVWSEETLGRPGCAIQFNAHPKIRPQWRYQNMKWNDLQPGTSPNFTAWRHMALEKGIAPPMYRFTC